MIPVRDPSQRFPAATVALIVANIAAFLHGLPLGPHLEAALHPWGVVPLFYTSAEARAGSATS